MDIVQRRRPFLFVYLDDILITSASEMEHLSHLCFLFSRLSQHVFFLAWVFLAFLQYCKMPGLIISSLLTLKALLEFLAIVILHHSFAPRGAQLMQPLYVALMGKLSKHAICWATAMSEASSATKEALASSTMLAHLFARSSCRLDPRHILRSLPCLNSESKV